MFDSIFKFFQEGGPTMFITASAGLVGGVIAVERGKKLFKDLNLNSPHFMGRVKELVVQNRFEEAVELCDSEKGGLVPRVVRSGLERMGCSEEIVRQNMEAVYLERVPEVTKNIHYLSLIANTGLLFGLLGTVLGLIRQFGALASADVADKQLLMARGIAEAMNNTALGLMVALPCLIIHGIYSSKANQLIEEMERSAAQFMDWVGLKNYGELEARTIKKKTGRTVKSNTT